MIRRGWMVAGALGLLVGCSPDELDAADAQVAWGATQRALNEGSATGGSVGVLGSKISYSCPDGGKAIFKHSLADSFAGAFDGSVGVEWSVKFKRCAVDGVAVKGNMDFAIATEVDGDSGVITEWSWVGDLKYGGDLRGSCAIDMTGMLSANASGAAMEYDGSICGHDASLTLSVDLDDAQDFDEAGQDAW